MNLNTIVFENNTLRIIDQTRLPQHLDYLELDNLEMVITAIKTMQVRGAPAIGVAAAYGMYIHARNLVRAKNLTRSAILQAAYALKSARPTAVNLSWAVDLLVTTFIEAQGLPEKEILARLYEKAHDIHQSDKKTCDLIGKYGAELLPVPATLLTHCNAGSLATGGKGTALSIVYHAQTRGDVHVYVDETRPRGQGAKLTYWELAQNGVPATLITDNMAAVVIKNKQIDAIVVGADRIAANGDVANKIGTYGLAVLANYHRVPFYVAAPLSTFDSGLKSGQDIPIEVRDKHELLEFWNLSDGATQYDVFNPAFDVTPAELISAIITEKGVISQPDSESIAKLFIHQS